MARVYEPTNRPKLYSYALTSIAILTFSLFSANQQLAYDPQNTIKLIQETGTFIPLQTWKAEFFECEAECQITSNEPKSIDFPAYSSLETIRNELSGPTNTVQLSSTLSIQTIDTIKKQGFLNLVIPSSVQSSISAQIGTSHYQLTAGNPLNIVWTINPKDLADDPRITITYNLPNNWTWFGPADFPIALVDPPNSTRYAQISNSQGFLQGLRSSWFILLPLLAAALSYIIDHSAAYRAFTAFLVIFGLRTFVYSLDSGNFVFGSLLFSNILLPIAFGNFSLKLFPNQFSGKIILGGMALVAIAMNISLFFSSSNYADLSDLSNDILMAVVGLFVMTISRKAGTAISKPTQQYTRYGLFAAALVMLIWANGHDLIRFLNEQPKNPLQIAHALPVVFLMIVTLVDLGSVQQLIKTKTSAQAKVTKYETELALSKSFQAAALPKNLNYESDKFQWNVYYRFDQQFSPVWFDIDLIRVGQKSFVLGCLFESNNQNIVAAQQTMLMHSRWEINKRYFSTGLSSYNEPSIDNFLKYCAADFNEHLLTKKDAGKSSAAIFCLDASESRFQHIGCGQARLFIQENQNVTYHDTSNSYLGTSIFDLSKTTSIALSSSQQVIVPSLSMIELLKTDSICDDLSLLLENVAEDRNSALIQLATN